MAPPGKLLREASGVEALRSQFPARLKADVIAGLRGGRPSCRITASELCRFSEAQRTALYSDLRNNHQILCREAGNGFDVEFYPITPPPAARPIPLTERQAMDRLRLEAERREEAGRLVRELRATMRQSELGDIPAGSVEALEAAGLQAEMARSLEAALNAANAQAFGVGYFSGEPPVRPPVGKPAIAPAFAIGKRKIRLAE